MFAPAKASCNYDSLCSCVIVRLLQCSSIFSNQQWAL